MTEKTKKPKRGKSGPFGSDNSVVRGVRWPMAIWTELEKIAGKEGVDVSTIIRDMTMAQLSNNVAYESLIASLKPEDSKVAQENFFNALDKSNEMILSEIHKNQEILIKKLNKQDKLIRELPYLIFYYNPVEVAESEKIERQRSANRRSKKFLENFDKENP